MNARPDLSVIVVNWNVRDLLRDCLASVRNQSTLAPECYEVIVVDNASHDGSAAMVREEFPDILLISNATNVGFGAANNQGYLIARGRFVLLLNPDTLMLPGAMDTLLSRIEERRDAAVIGSRLLNRDRSLQKWTGGSFPTLWNIATHYLFLDLLLPAGLRPKPLYLVEDLAVETPVDWVSGACLILRREALGERIFDPAFFMYGEDMELCHRVKAAGHEVLYCPEATIIHFQGESMKQQQGDILLSSLKGPRQFFQLTRSATDVRIMDILTLAGFGLRALLYLAASLAKRKSAMRDKARSSYQYFCIALKLMRSAP